MVNLKFAVLANPGKKTKIYNVLTTRNDTHLGFIRFHSPWRQYAFFPEMHCLFASDCLTEITDKLVDLNTARKSALAAKKILDKMWDEHVPRLN